MNQPPPNQLAQGQQQERGLLRPEQMRNIAYLTAEEKRKYEEGLRQLWHKIEQNGPETPEHQSAKQKVADFSRMVMNKIKSIQDRQKFMQAQAQQSQASQPAAAQGGQAPGVPAAGPKGVQPNAARPMAANAAGAAASPAMNAPPAGSIPKHVAEHVNKLPWSTIHPPASVPPDQATKFVQEMKSRYLRGLVTMETIKTKFTRIDAMVKDREQKGTPLSPEELKKIQDQRQLDTKQYQDADKYVKYVRGHFQIAQQAGGQGQNGAQMARSNSMQSQVAGASASSHPMQAATASVNATIETAKNQQQMGTANRAGSQQPPTPAPTTPSTNAAGQQQAQQQQPQAQAHPAPAPQPQVKVEPGTHAQPPPPVNTALAAAAGANMASGGTPTPASARVQTPQTNTQQAAGAVRPLSHMQAVNRANSSTNVTAQPTPGVGAGATTTPGATSLTGSASQPGHTHAHPQPGASTLTPKMPIPKQLPENATKIPQPVTVGGGNVPGRPTYGAGNGAGGVMNQPVIPKMPVPQFDTEGDHMVSKKKLDELVRQVCGGGSPGTDNNFLTPDVEESVLNAADNFVDSVVHSACRLAKERGSKVLEIRDLQLVMERVYNIRIPGYTSDELRTVRKVQPAPQWIAKMSAIQAAKVTASKDDK
ncbi:transcription initiation factor TFIID subunit A-domain-containing protein [Xylariomycetidae sp. FL0641]|nr:transcription initiation factor TFIID subunit A-domain-containing protein [Xylariomycetidae sp. FL0641]